MASKNDSGLDFSFRAKKDGDVAILRNGKAVTVLRGDSARSFLAEIGNASLVGQQLLMARVTGNYKRGNERFAAGHARNRRRDDA